MSHPATGQFREPGAALPGFIRPTGDPGVADKIAELLHHAKVRENSVAMRALEALDGTDPTLYPIASRVRPSVKAILARYERDLAAARANPERRFKNAAGIEREEAAIRVVRDAALADLEKQLTAQLADVREGLEAKLAAARGGTVADEDAAEAHAMADRLGYLSPERGLAELVQFLDQVGVGERSREQLVALVPILQSAHEGSGPWAGRDDLAQLISIGESLTDGGWPAAVASARLERAERLGGDLSLFMSLARTHPSGLDATVTQAVDAGGRRAGGFALFPEQLPPDGPALEDEDGGDYNPLQARGFTATPEFKRSAVSAEQRAADEAARAAQE